MGTAIEGVKHVVAVASGKGGVGKSTTAVNLAVCLAAQGLKVGLLDADVYGPSMPRMLGLKDARPESDGEIITPVVAHGVKAMSMGFVIDEETPVVWRGPLVQKALVDMLRKVDWAGKDGLDILVVDMPPGTGDIALSLAQQVSVSGAVIVSTPQDVALIDARKALEMFKKVNVPILGIVENMSAFVCPHCGERSHIFGAHGAAKMARDVGVELLAEVPLALDVRERTDAGDPVPVSLPDSPISAVYRAFAGRVWELVSAPGGVKVVISGQ